MKENTENFILLTDSYKTSHWKIYPKELQVMYSYLESRVGATHNGTLVVGPQALIKKNLLGKDVITKEKIAEAKIIIDAHMGPGVFNEEGWNNLLVKYKGALPIRIKAVPEGMVIPTGNVLMSIENTDEEFPWLTNYLETYMVQVWYPMTVATNSYEQKKIILDALEKTGDPAGIMFKLHDFGFRGVTSVEAAGLGGMAHLVNFMGTDTIMALLYADRYYNANKALEAGIAGFSIPATEHSQMSLLGRKGEPVMMKRLLEQFPTGLLACVSDTYDIIQACRDYWGGELKDAVMERDGVLVIRPDSGDATKILPEIMGILGQAFGQTKNAKGYYVLNDKVRVIQGDNVDIETLPQFIKAITDAGYSADNIAFGSGGGLLQKVNRDTQRFAFKCSAAKIDGEWRYVQKDPVTAGEFAKKSKQGRLALVKDGEGYRTIENATEEDMKNDILEVVYENGVLVKEYDFAQVRANAEIKVAVPA